MVPSITSSFSDSDTGGVSFSELLSEEEGVGETVEFNPESGGIGFYLFDSGVDDDDFDYRDFSGFHLSSSVSLSKLELR